MHKSTMHHTQCMQVVFSVKTETHSETALAAIETISRMDVVLVVTIALVNRVSDSVSTCSVNTGVSVWKE